MGEKLLIVDDEQEIREMLAEYFEWNGYTVLTAESGIRALELAEREPWCRRLFRFCKISQAFRKELLKKI